MAVQLQYLGGKSVLPDISNYVISYIRNPKKFPINKYAQFVETPLQRGAYWYIDPDQPVRVVSDAEFAWADGQPRPTGYANQMPGELLQFVTDRRDYPWTLGDMAVENIEEFSGHDLREWYAAMVASLGMTNRTNRTAGVLTNAANWGSNTATANTLNGGAGQWTYASSDPTSPYYLAIKKSLMTAYNIITLSTNAVVKLSDLRLVISPTLATTMGNTSEVYDYVKYSDGSKETQAGTDRDVGGLRGVPPELYGIEIVVEDTPIVNIRANWSTATPAVYNPASIAAGSRAFCWPQSVAVLMSRIGGIEGPYGAPSFSTYQIYFYGAPMQVEQFHEAKDRLTEGHVSENYVEVLAAPASGFCITGCM
jgi:hypothetical protein